MFIVSVVHLEAATPHGEQMSTIDHLGAAQRMENDNLQIIPKQQDEGNIHFTKNYPTRFSVVNHNNVIALRYI